MPPSEVRPRPGEVPDEAAQIMASGLFEDVTVRQFGWQAVYTAEVPQPPPVLVATESWPPNLTVADHHLRPRGARVAGAADDDGGLPFRTGAFDLVVSRHPVVVHWAEVARVLAPGGVYLSQQVKAESNRELSDFLTGTRPVSESRSPRRAAAEASACGLDVVDLREEALRVEVYDVAAVVHFLRKVLWARKPA